MSGIIEGSGTTAAALIQMLVPIIGNYAFIFYGGKQKLFFVNGLVLAMISAVFLTPTATREYKQWAKTRQEEVGLESQFESPVQV